MKPAYDEVSRDSLDALARVVTLPPRCDDCGGRFVAKSDINPYCGPCEERRWQTYLAECDLGWHE